MLNQNDEGTTGASKSTEVTPALFLLDTPLLRPLYSFWRGLHYKVAIHVHRRRGVSKDGWFFPTASLLLAKEEPLKALPKDVYLVNVHLPNDHTLSVHALVCSARND